MNGITRNIVGNFMKRLYWPLNALIPKQTEIRLCSNNSNGLNLLDEKFGKSLEGPTLHDFMNSDSGHGNSVQVPDIPYLKHNKFQRNARKGRPTHILIMYLYIPFCLITNPPSMVNIKETNYRYKRKSFNFLFMHLKNR